MSRRIGKALLVISLSLAVFIVAGNVAHADEYNMTSGKQYVFDDADLISELDEDALSSRCEEVSKEFEIDIAVATTYNTDGRSAKDYAEDLIVDEDLGYEEDGRVEKSCVLFLLDLDNGETYIATSGLGILCVEDDDIERILDQVYIYVYSDYYMACLAYVDKTADIIEHNMNRYAKDYVDDWKNHQYDYDTFERKYVNEKYNIFSNFRYPGINLLISAIVAGVTVYIMGYKNKARMTVNGNTYMDINEFVIHVNEDHFLNTTSTRHKLSSSSGSSSSHHGGSHHSGSGGRSFGGGGRKL